MLKHSLTGCQSSLGGIMRSSQPLTICAVAIACLMVGVCASRAQHTRSSLEFEVAVIKRNVSAGSVFAGCYQSGVQTISPGTCIFRNTTLGEIIAAAYGFPGPRARPNTNVLSGEPSWVNTERYDIEAKASAASTGDELLAMLRTLLAMEFRLVAHETTREVAGYGLRTAKGGPKMKPGDGLTRSGMASNRTMINAANVLMPFLATRLTGILREPVIDLTGLTGTYTFVLSFSADLNDPSGPSLFTALQEQVGLRLEAMRVPTRILVIDHVQRRKD
jgi:uncharacterized protein (TIGR03435 family)